MGREMERTDPADVGPRGPWVKEKEKEDEQDR